MVVAHSMRQYYISMSDATDCELIFAFSSDKIPYYCGCDDAEVMVEHGNQERGDDVFRQRARSACASNGKIFCCQSLFEFTAVGHRDDYFTKNLDNSLEIKTINSHIYN